MAAWREDRPTAVLLLAVIAFSDVLDGWIARRFKLTTPVGAFLDPLADKLCQVTALVVLAAHEYQTFTRIPPWFVVVVLARDLVQLYGVVRMAVARKKMSIRPRWSGKLCTVLVFAIIFASLFRAGATAMLVACVVAAPLVVTAAVQYTRDGRRQFKLAGSS